MYYILWLLCFYYWNVLEYKYKPMSVDEYFAIQKADLSNILSTCRLIEVTWHTLFLVSETHWCALLAIKNFSGEYTKSEHFITTSIPPMY